MNRTYWALALGCNVVVLDSVYYVFDQYLNQHCPAYRFWKMVKTTDACTKQVGSVHRRSSDYCYTTQIDEHNYQEVYASLYGVEWHFPRPDALLLFDMGRDSWTSSFSWRSEEHTSELQSRLHLVFRLL